MENQLVKAQKGWKQGLVNAGVIAAATVASTAHAFTVDSILSGSDAESNGNTIALFVLGIVLIIFTLRMSKSTLNK